MRRVVELEKPVACLCSNNFLGVKNVRVADLGDDFDLSIPLLVALSLGRCCDQVACYALGGQDALVLDALEAIELVSLAGMPFADRAAGVD